MRIDEFAYPDFNEHFEAAPGLDETYDFTIIESGNTFNPDFDTALLPGGTPAGWGAQCAHVTIGPDFGGAGYAKGNELVASSTGFRTHVSFMLISESLENELGNLSFQFAKPLGSVLGAVANWRLFVIQTGANRHFLFGAGNDAATHVYPVQPGGGGISEGLVYNHVVEYNFLTATYNWWVNDVLAGTGAINPAWAQTIGWKVIGMSASSVGRNSAYMIDRCVWTEIKATLGALDLVAFPSFGFDVESGAPVVYDTLYFDSSITRQKYLDAMVTRSKARDARITRTKAFDFEG